MAQHDYIISNQTFPNTRQDINNLASAIATNNSGTSAPTTQYAGQWWIDTTSTTWTLYIHDGTDDIQFATIDTSANTVNFIDSTFTQLTSDLASNGNDINFGDNDKAQFGAGNDLQIYHDGSESFITDAGTGRLFIGAENFLILSNANNTEYYLRATNNGALDLYYDNAIKLSTTSTGVDVTGTVVSDGLTVDTNTLYVDSSNNRVGIGTSSPGEKLAVSGNAYVAGNVVSRNGAGTQGVDLSQDGYIEIARADSDAFIDFKTSTSEDFDVRIQQVSNGLIFQTGGDGSTSERLRIDSSGNVLVSTTSTPATLVGTSSEVGIGFSNAGFGVFVRDDSVPLYANRLNGDGTLVEFRKDGTAVGSIGNVGSYLVIGSGATGLFFDDNQDSVKPRNSNGSARDNAIDLGSSTNRFNDLYLGGNIYLGGTGSANALDDYETGTWTPEITYATPGTLSVSYSAQTAKYTKVGNTVIVHWQIRLSAFSKGTASGGLLISGLPFAGDFDGNIGTLGLYNASFTGTPISKGSISVIGLLQLSSNSGWSSLNDPDSNAQYFGTLVYTTSS